MPQEEDQAAVGAFGGWGLSTFGSKLRQQTEGIAASIKQQAIVPNEGDSNGPGDKVPEKGTNLVGQAGPSDGDISASSTGDGGSGPTTPTSSAPVRGKPLSSRKPEDVSRDELLEILSKMNKRVKALNAARLQLEEKNTALEKRNGGLVELLRNEVLTDADIDDASAARAREDESDKKEQDDGEVALLKRAWRAADERKSLMLQQLQNEFRVMTMKTEAEIQKVRKQAEAEKEAEAAKFREELQSAAVNMSESLHAAGDDLGVEHQLQEAIRQARSEEAAKLSAQLEEARSASDAARAELAALQNQISDASVEVERKMAEAAKTHNAELDRVRAECNDEVASKLSALREELEGQHLTMREEEICRVRSDAERARKCAEEKVKLSLESQMEDMRLKHEQVVSALREEGAVRSSADLDRLRLEMISARDEEVAQVRAQAEEQLSSEVEKVRNEASERVASVTSESASREQLAKAKAEALEKRIIDLSLQLEQAIKERDKALSDLDNVREQAACASSAAVIAQEKNTEEKVEAALTEQKATFLTKLKAYKEKQEEKMKQIQVKLQKKEEMLALRDEEIRKAREELAQLSDELKCSKAESESILLWERDEAASRLRDLQSRCEALQRVDVERLDKLKDLERQIESHRFETKDATDRHASEVANMRERHADDVAALESRLEDNSEKGAVIVAELTSQVEGLRDDVKKTEERQLEVEMVAATAKAEHEVEMRRIRDDVERERAEFHIKLTNIREEHEDKVARLLKEKEDAVSNLNTLSAEQLRVAEESNRTKVAELEMLHHEDKVEAERRYNELKKDYETIVAQLESEVDSNRAEELKTSFERQIAELKKDHSVSLARQDREKELLKEELDSKLRDELMVVSQERVRAVAVLEDEKRDLTAHLKAVKQREECLSQSMQEHSSKINELQRTIEMEAEAKVKEITALKEDHKRDLSRKEEESVLSCDRLKVDFDARMKTLREEHASTVDRLEEEKRAHMRALEQESAMKVSALEDSLVGEREVAKKELAKLKADHRVASDAMEQEKVSLSKEMESYFQEKLRAAEEKYSLSMTSLQQERNSLLTKLEEHASQERDRNSMEKERIAKIQELESILAGEREKLTKETAAFEQSIATLQAEKKSLMSQLQSKEGHEQELRLRDNASSERTAELEMLLSSEMEKLQRVTKDHSKAMSILQEENKSLRTQLEDKARIEEELLVSENERSEKVAELESLLASEREKMNDTLEEHGKALKNLKEEKESFRMSHLESSEKYEMQISALQSDLSSKDAEIEQLSIEEQSKMKKAEDEHRHLIEKIEEEKCALLSQVEAIPGYEAKLNSLQAEHSSKISEMERLLASERENANKKLILMKEKCMAAIDRLKQDKSSVAEQLKMEFGKRQEASAGEHKEALSRLEEDKRDLLTQLQEVKASEAHFEMAASEHSDKVASLEKQLTTERDAFHQRLNATKSEHMTIVDSLEREKTSLSHQLTTDFGKRLQSTMEEYQGNIARLEDEKRALTTQLQGKNKDEEKLKATESDLTSRIAAAESRVASEQEACKNRLIAMKDKCQSAIDAMKEEKQAQSEQLKLVHDKKLKQVEEKYSVATKKLESTIAEKDKARKRLEDEVASARALSSSLNDDNSTLQKQLTSHITSEQKLQERVKVLQSELKKSSDESAATTSSLLDQQEKLEDENKELKKEIAELQSEHSGAKNNVEELSKKLEVLSANLSSMAETRKEQEKQLDHARKQEEKLKKTEAELSTMREEANELKLDQAQSNGLVARLQAEKDASERKHGQRTALLGMLEAQLSEMKEGKEEITQKMEEASEEIRKKDEELNRIKAELERSEAESNRKKAEASKSAEKDSEMAKELQKEVQLLQQQMARKSAAAQRLLKEREAECKKLRETNKALRQEVDQGTLSDRRIFELAAKQSSRDSAAASEIEIREKIMERLRNALSERDGDLASAEHNVQQVEGQVAELCRVRRREDVNIDYLKSVVVQYLSKPPGSTERASLLPVLATLLQFDANDYKLIEEGKKKVGWWGSIVPTEIGSEPEDNSSFGAVASALANEAGRQASVFVIEASRQASALVTDTGRQESQQQVAPLLSGNNTVGEIKSSSRISPSSSNMSIKDMNSSGRLVSNSSLSSRNGPKRTSLQF